jgi:hypothetical protein
MPSDLTHFFKSDNKNLSLKLCSPSTIIHFYYGYLARIYIYTSQPKISVRRYTITKHIDKCTKVLIVLYSNNNNKPPSFCGQILNYNV